MQGLKGSTRASVRRIPAATLRPLPPIREGRTDLAAIAQAMAESPGLPSEERHFDVFISHASEDKEELVRPLAHALEERGLEVWLMSSS